jgi:hypothetical protein
MKEHLPNKVRSPRLAGKVPSRFGPPNDTYVRVLERRANSLGMVPCRRVKGARSDTNLVNSPISVGIDPERDVD